MEFRVLGEPADPEGDWAGEAVFVSRAALRQRRDPHEVAAAVPGAEVLPGGLIRIVVAHPGELLGAEPGAVPQGEWPDLPRTWDNPGFVVRYAHVRALNTERWAAELGVAREPFRGELLDGVWDRRVLRVLAELPARQGARNGGWASYSVRLALAYHDAHERAPAVPKGDEPASALHTARVRLAEAVRKVLPGPDRL
ncbi:anticodon-binding protein [Nonomuraea sp. NPDC050310]|uniref:anticodon-binding protein n=1 Tax=unclassified Nonomuraea TaxID=2593643 RepID=UPI0033CD7F9B